MMQHTYGQDWNSYDSVKDIGTKDYRNITASNNLLMYIYSNEDGKTHVYDKTDRNTTQTSCSLQSN